MESFHASEEAALRAHILSAVAKNKSREQSDPVAEALRSFDSIHDPQARYCAFAIDAIEKDFQNASAQSGTLARVSQQYDAATAEVLEHWLKAYWWHEYNDGLTEEIEEEIIRRADARVEMIRNTQTATDIASRSVDIL
jgi:hypothetical protein